jgi:hypothetical protein
MCNHVGDIDDKLHVTTFSLFVGYPTEPSLYFVEYDNFDDAVPEAPTGSLGNEKLSEFIATDSRYHTLIVIYADTDSEPAAAVIKSVYDLQIDVIDEKSPALKLISIPLSVASGSCFI